MSSLVNKSVVNSADPSPNNSRPSHPYSNYIKRVLAALVMAPLGIWVVWEGGVHLVVATTLCALLASYEWSSMIMAKQINLRSIVLFAFYAFGAFLAVCFQPYGYLGILLIAFASAFTVFAYALFCGLPKWSIFFGGIYLTLPFGSFVFLREMDGPAFSAMLSIMVFVWGTDSAAFIAGKAYGGPAFSPKNSPGKTWTGAVAGVIYAAMAGLACANLTQSSMFLWIGFAVLISVFTQLGDLLESMFKRQFGIKDMSNIIPGHGGVLDRLDGLMAAVVVSTLVFVFFPQSVELLFGVQT